MDNIHIIHRSINGMPSDPLHAACLMIFQDGMKDEACQKLAALCSQVGHDQTEINPNRIISFHRLWIIRSKEYL